MNKVLTIFCYRSSDKDHKEPYYKKYQLEITGPITIQQVLSIIHEKMDSSLDFFYHAACGQAVCGRCAVKVNSRNVLACLMTVHKEDTIFLEPAFPDRVVKDLLCK